MTLATYDYHIARRGRTRTNSKRERDGRKQRDRSKDEGAELVRLRKQEIVGQGNDPAAAESALGVLAATGYITAEQRDAGLAFSAKWWAVNGRPFAKVPSLPIANPDQTGADAPRPTLMTDEEREARFLKLRKALRDAGEAAFNAVVTVAVQDRLPGWWMRARGGKPFPSDGRERRNLTRGLDALLT